MLTEVDVLWSGNGRKKNTKKLGNGKVKVQITEGESPKTCTLCGKLFKNNRCLKKHLVSHSENRPYACTKCDRRFKLKHQLTNHTRVHKDDVWFECDFCTKKLRSKAYLAVHRKRHTKEYIAKCEVCGQGFVTIQEYNHHIGAKHGNSTYICNICGRSCYDKAVLQNHMETHDEDYGKNKQINCEQCGKTFTRMKYLKGHINRVHKDGGERFVCHHCGKEIHSKTSLRDHLLIHQGLKPLQCPKCYKCFTIRSTLKAHLRTHTGDRPYHCKQCGKAFTQRSPLIIHMRYHTGERPYQCNLCIKAFVSKAVLSLHQKKAHVVT